MKNENSGVKKRRFLAAFLFVTALNIMLGIFLLKASFGQTVVEKFEDQAPIIAEVVIQKDSPLRLVITNVDNSPSAYQTINLSVENLDSQSIKGYVILAGSKKDTTGRIFTNFFPVKSLQAKSNVPDEIEWERSNIQPSDILYLSVDYVEFEDGSFWGQDTQGQSEQIVGSYAGVKAAVEYLKNLADKRDASLTALLEKELVDVDVPLTNSAQSEKWQNGFKEGYKSIVYYLKQQNDNNFEKVTEKLGEIKKNQMERNQKP